MSNTGSPFGIKNSGFVPKLQADSLKDITTAMRSNVDPNLDMSPSQPIGQIAAACSSEYAALWELGAVCWSGINPSNASGFVADAVSSYTGTERDEEQFSTVVCALGLNASSTVPQGALASVSGQPTNKWQLLGPADPTSGLLLLSDGSVTSTGAGTYYGMFQATQPGPLLANAGQLTVIVSTSSGWNSITNANGANLGSIVETDAQLLTRREEELASSGNDTVDATVAALLAIKVVGSPTQTAVLQAFVYENDTDVTATGTVPAGCPAGVTPHTMYAVVYDGVVPQATNNQIAQAIWNNKPSGTTTYGSLSGTAIDSQGTQRTVNFDRATIVPMYISLTTTRGPTFDSVNGPEAIGSALVEYWATQQNLGVSAINRFFGAAANNQDIKGLQDIPAFNMGTSFSSITTANIVASGLQVLTLTTGLDGGGHGYILVDGVSV